MASHQNMTVDQMRQILNEVIDTLESPDYSSKLDEAKEAAGNEMLKMMQIVFPMVVQIEMETIKRHGFSNSREGKNYIRFYIYSYFGVMNEYFSLKRKLPCNTPIYYIDITHRCNTPM